MESSLDYAGVLLAFSSALDLKAFCHRVVGVLPLGVGIDLVFGGIVDCREIKPAILPRGLVRI